MKSLQICLLSALLVIAASNPIPADEPASSTLASVVPDVTTAVKSPIVPAVATDVPAAQKSLPIENEKEIPEPQALPSKKEETSPVAFATAEEKKREVAAEQQPTVKPVETPTESAKLSPEQPKEAIAVASTPKTEQSQPTEAVRSINVEKLAAPEPTVPAVDAVVAPGAKQVDVKQAVESTVVPVVPSSIASEKKIDAEAPVPIVSENVQKPASEVVNQELKSALPVAAEQVQTAPQQHQELAQTQERSAPESAAVPVVAASKIEPTAAPLTESASGSGERKVDEDDSSSSSEESEEKLKEKTA